MDIQALVAAINQVAADQRSKYQMTLGKMIETLNGLPVDARISYGDGASPGIPESYRGYYSDLSFRDTVQPINVGSFLDKCQQALNETFEGYKGGDYRMGQDTPLWRSEYGEASGLAIMDVVAAYGQVVLTTKQVED